MSILKAYAKMIPKYDNVRIPCIIQKVVPIYIFTYLQKVKNLPCLPHHIIDVKVSIAAKIYS